MQPHEFYGGLQLPLDWWPAGLGLGGVILMLLPSILLLILAWLAVDTLLRLRRWLIRQERAYEDAREDAELQRRQRAIEREAQARQEAASRSATPQSRIPLAPGERKEPHL